MAKIPRLRAVLIHAATRSAWTQPLAVVYCPYNTNPEVPYCNYELVTNGITAVKISFFFFIPVVNGLIYYGCQTISIQGSIHPVYNYP